MSELFKRLKGFADLRGQEASAFTRMESLARDIFSRYGFREIRTPILEFTDLFQRSIGDATDVVQKEMFTFADGHGRSISLRPEATAGVMRASIDAGLARNGAVARLFTLGPMFRRENPQKGRMRQFHQINCEFLGSASPWADAELIRMLLHFLEALRLKGLRLKLNSLGCRECRPAYHEKLVAFLRGLPAESFCQDCRARIGSNPLRVLDCKRPECRDLARDAPRMMDSQCGACKAHMDRVMELLGLDGIAFELDHHLVRGLDYYCRTTFEVCSDAIGAQTAVAGGGRYDGLIAQLGGEDIPGVGFACGMERLALLLAAEDEPRPDFYLLAPGEAERLKAFQLERELRAAGFSGEMNLEGGSFKSLMRQAGKSGAAVCLILGPDELAAGEICVKNMESGGQARAAWKDLPGALAAALGK